MWKPAGSVNRFQIGSDKQMRNRDIEGVAQGYRTPGQGINFTCLFDELLYGAKNGEALGNVQSRRSDSGNDHAYCGLF
ncbi:unnamed protein product [Protopolystoma xenopodis]|uniref:Uncharacterized protein n=1 Tax=Protopolystoma xenopodis TaxID=117903 RepID=A0A3S5CQU7_9PLAT|nr:unnamed protein product [Protopolystoma xenopodis]